MKTFSFDINIPEQFYSPASMNCKETCYTAMRIFELIKACFGNFEVSFIVNKIDAPESTTIIIELEDNKLWKWKDASIKLSFAYPDLEFGLSYYMDFDNNSISRKFDNETELKFNDKMPEKLIIVFEGAQLPQDKYMYDTEKSCKSYFRSLYEDQHETDITITAGEKSIRAHKIILARSPFLKRLIRTFKNYTCESIELTDMKHEVLEDFIYYLYCDEVLDIKKNALELMFVGTTYEVPNLVYDCKNYLMQHIDNHNYAKILVAIEKFPDAKDLKEKIMHFIIEHGKDLLNTTEWKELKDHSDLMVEITENILKFQIT